MGSEPQPSPGSAVTYLGVHTRALAHNWIFASDTAGCTHMPHELVSWDIMPEGLLGTVLLVATASHKICSLKTKEGCPSPKRAAGGASRQFITGCSPTGNPAPAFPLGHTNDKGGIPPLPPDRTIKYWYLAFHKTFLQSKLGEINYLCTSYSIQTWNSPRTGQQMVWWGHCGCFAGWCSCAQSQNPKLKCCQWGQLPGKGCVSLPLPCTQLP